jgi:hypothetical protein
MKHIGNLKERLEICRPIIPELGEAKLYKIYRNCYKLWDKLDNELIECRRMGRITTKYTEISSELDQAIVVLEQHLVFGSLLK